MVDLKQSLQTISFFAGNRFDLVQAGGGNTSVKLDQHRMLVKASGINLSEVTCDSGYVEIDYLMIREFLAEDNFSALDKKQREHAANTLMAESRLSETGRPSIETFLHALLNRHTLHTHPVSVNIIAARPSWKQDLQSVWPDAIYVPYQTPGIDLALALANELYPYITQHNGEYPKVVFLQNHGLIVSSNDPDEVINITNAVTQKIEQQLGLDLIRYRNVTPLQATLKTYSPENLSIICSDDSTIEQLLSCEDQSAEIWPFCPDTLIYCGVRPVFLQSLDHGQPIKDYMDAYHEHPKVIIVNQQVYFCASSLKKAKEAQDLFKFHLLVIQQPQNDTQRLSLEEIAYLSNWDAEKYRQGV